MKHVKRVTKAHPVKANFFEDLWGKVQSFLGQLAEWFTPSS